MLRKILAVMAICSALTASAQTGSYQQRAQAYVDQYKDLAMAEQQRSGIPAAITLGQGILETEAGNSELATKANNHFGIKCKKEWKGETFAHTDDLKDECFRKYSCANDSYKDHSDYLKGSPRYTPCFQQKLDNYKGWATNLRRCGYATNPRYAQTLIQIIEDFHLQDYTLAAMQGAATVTPTNIKQPATAAKTIVTEAQPKPTATPAEVVPTQDAITYKVDKGSNEQTTATPPPAAVTDDPIVYGQIVHKNGLKGFYAHKGDVLLESAVKYHQRYAHLLELNDLPDAPLAADQFIYLEKKSSKGARTTHIIQPGETMAQIAQTEGIQLRELRNLNQLENGEEPTVGTRLELQHYAAAKPHIAAIHIQETVPAAHPTPATTSTDYVPVAHTATQQAPQETPAAPVQQTQPIATTTQETTQPVAATQNATSEKPGVNIANETAVEEQPNATTEPVKAPEPQDEFSKLKAKLDKVVYTKPAVTVTVPTAATAKTTTATSAPTTPATTPQATGEQWYTVTKGDTAFSITKKYNITMKQLQAYNHLEGFEALHIGQKLRVH